MIKRFQHAQFNKHTLHGDIGVLHVEGKMNEVGEVAPIPLLDRSLVPGDKITIYGWNFDFLIGEETEQLFRAETQVIDPQICEHHYGTQFIGGEMLCMDMYTFEDKAADVQGCEMDPASPITFTRDGAKYLGGIALFAGGCMYMGWPGVFVDTFPYTQWINERLAVVD